MILADAQINRSCEFRCVPWVALTLGSRQWAADEGTILVPDFLNWNPRIHSLGTGWLLFCAGLNFHCWAASIALRAKYLLGPGDSNFAFVTLPDESTVTRTPTLTVPWMVFLAVFETSGKTCWSTSS